MTWLSLSIIKQPTSTSCSHIFCNECIIKKIQQKQMCPLCNQSVKENQLYPVATLDVIIEEFIKMKQDYLIDELTHLSAGNNSYKKRASDMS